MILELLELLWYFLPFFFSHKFSTTYENLYNLDNSYIFWHFFLEITISEIVFDFLLLLKILIIFDNLNNFVWQFWTIITLIDNYANVENVHNSSQFLDLAIQNKMVGSFPYSSFALSLSYVCFHSNWCQKRWRYKFSYTICPIPTKISIHG